VKTRLIAALLTLTATVSLVADPADKNRAVTRTVVVRDGKVITDTGDVVVDRMLLGGKRGYIGVSTVDLTEDLREHYGAPKDAGVLVGSVEDNSPADKAGLKVGDIVISVDGKDIDSQMDLRRAISDKKEGDSVRIDVLRGRNRQTIVATVAEREGARLFTLGELGDLPTRLGPEWRARIESAGNCGELQARIKDLETRLKDLEKKLK
jgi:membrane-associated protease RseP (regulator of RpoE activity)